MSNNYGWIEINKVLLYHKAYYHTPSALARSAYFHVMGAGHFICHPDFHLKRKEYKCFLVKLTLDGSGYLRYKGKQYELPKNSILIIDCNELHEYYTYNCKAWDNIWIHFNGGTSQEYYNIILDNYGPVFELTENSTIKLSFGKIIEMMEYGDSQFEIKTSQIILEILTSILLAVSAGTKAANKTGNSDYIQTSLDFIEKNYSTNITVDDIAHAANISVFHFLRQFKKAIGFTPYEYLVKYRMNKAKSMLMHSRLSIQDIAEQVGFRDTPTFIRAFKRLEEITPLKYRNNQ